MEQKDTRKLIKEAIDEMIAGNSVVTLSDLDKLAEEGGGAAMYWMSKRYKHGFPISSIDPKTGRKTTIIHYDSNKAEQLLQQSAELGYPPAQCYLGISLLKGREMEKNEQEGIEWLKKSANNSLKAAMDKLEELGVAWKEETDNTTTGKSEL